MRWSHEASYDPIIQRESAALGVPVALIKGIIGAESAFVAVAVRGEPQIGDASYGLMQVLHRTAKALGYSGPADGLLDPATNIHYGTKLLAQNLARAGGDTDAAISAYNGGFRAQFGFGARATRLIPNVCLARDASGKCVRTVDVQPNTFANQAYVNRVRANMQYFQSQVPLGPGPDTGPVAQPDGAAGQSTTGLTLAALVSAALIGILVWWRGR